MAFIIILTGNNEDTGKTFTVDKPLSVIGRLTVQNKPDIALNDEVVSRQHLEILLKDDKYWVKDLGSTNGSMLNDDRILAGQLYELKHNSRIGLGLEGTSARIILVFKESEDTSIIHMAKSAAGKLNVKPEIAWLKIDEGKREVSIDGEPKKLSKKEYDLLLFLYKNSANVCSRDEIIEAVWPESRDSSAISDATIDQLIHRLRGKVEPDPANPSRIISRKGFGYILV